MTRRIFSAVNGAGLTASLFLAMVEVRGPASRSGYGPGSPEQPTVSD
jgi:hypothetical protein